MVDMRSSAVAVTYRVGRLAQSRARCGPIANDRGACRASTREAPICYLRAGGSLPLKERKMFISILVPVDIAETEVARPALDKAVELAKASGAALRLTHVRSPVPY